MKPPGGGGRLHYGRAGRRPAPASYRETLDCAESEDVSGDLRRVSFPDGLRACVDPESLGVHGEVVPWEDPPAEGGSVGDYLGWGRPSWVPAAKGGRDLRLDALRGWALLYMLVSHSAIGLGWATWWPRGLGWMLFVVVSGSLWRRRLGRRYLEVLVAGVVSIPAAVSLDLALWNILLGWAVVLPVLWVLHRLPVVWLSVVGVQLVWLWPLGGSSPGLVLLGFLIGQTAGRDAVGSAAAWLPRWRWVLWVSRHPLTVYVGHLWAFALVRHLTGG